MLRYLSSYKRPIKVRQRDNILAKPLHRKHDRNQFNCGIEALNNYLKVMANQQAKKDNTRAFVLEDDNDKLQKNHQSSTSGGVIARLAVDERYKGKGFGDWLLIDALKSY